jgi:hypothetical protein
MIELIKIGSLMGSPVGKKPMIMLRCDDESLKYYTDILVNNYKEYGYQKTNGIIRDKRYKGIPDFEPKVGESFTLDETKFWTSEVIRIIDDKILITRNSVYALHDISKLREEKIGKILN